MTPDHRLPEKLRPSLLGALCAAALAAGAVLWSHAALQKAQQENVTARLHLQQMEQQLKQADSNAATMAETLRRYRQLREAGIVGESTSQQWAEALEKIRLERTPRSFDYQIGAPVSLPEGNPGIHILSTRLRLQADVRHETDLLELLARLEMQIRALVALQGCRLTRQPSREGGLHVRCESRLITLLPAAQP